MGLEQQSDNSNKKLSKAIADFPDADLPIADTDDLLVNQAGVWKKVNKGFDIVSSITNETTSDQIIEKFNQFNTL
jgi:hypothetical protein